MKEFYTHDWNKNFNRFYCVPLFTLEEAKKDTKDRGFELIYYSELKNEFGYLEQISATEIEFNPISMKMFKLFRSE